VVKFYDNLRLVYEVRSRLNEMAAEEAAERAGKPSATTGKSDQTNPAPDRPGEPKQGP
jgi:hypothetical protein